MLKKFITDTRFKWHIFKLEMRSKHQDAKDWIRARINLMRLIVLLFRVEKGHIIEDEFQPLLNMDPFATRTLSRPWKTRYEKLVIKLRTYAHNPHLIQIQKAKHWTQKWNIIKALT